MSSNGSANGLSNGHTANTVLINDEEPKRILCVGLVCLDVFHVVKSFPVEDSDQRSLDQYTSRGGNASNSCSVLSQLGETCEYFGTMASNTLELPLIEQDFKRFGIRYDNCVHHDDVICPKSCVIVNAKTGSRTIVHTNKNMPELTLDDLKERIDLDAYDWVHFEGRNIDNVKTMVPYVKSARPDLTVSVEVEKVNRNCEALLPLGDVVFLSKDVARSHGARSMEEAVMMFRDRLKPGARLICAWGEMGAAAGDKDGNVYTAPAYPPAESIVDTLGAGDTFNASVILSLKNGKTLEKAIDTGCRVAGAKVGQKGFFGLSRFASLFRDGESCNGATTTTTTAASTAKATAKMAAAAYLHKGLNKVEIERPHGETEVEGACA